MELCGLTLKNPVMNASGTFGSGMEYASLTDLDRPGALVTKGVSSSPWEGNPTPRVVETPSGMLNAIGLQNPGLEVFIRRDLAFLSGVDTRVIVNVCGHSEAEYEEVAERLNEEDRVDFLEINVSCPNVKEGAIAFGTDPGRLKSITKALRAKTGKPMIIKLSPNVTDITELAKAAESEGADALSLINTLTGMKIDIEKRKFALANRTGGLSGPAIRPVALRMVYDVSHAVKIPVIGMGGITNAADALEFLMAGARAVAVGMYLFHDPDAMIHIIEGLTAWMEKEKLSDINEIIGIL